MKIFTYRICSNIIGGLIWSFVVWVSFVLIFSIIFYNLDVSTDILSASIAGVTIIFGYFCTHYLEIQRKRYDKKLEQYWELLKAIRVFILEKNLDTEERKKLISQFQDTYLGSSLFISSEAYKELKITIEMLMNHIKENKTESLDKFTQAQSKFINCLRKELGEKEIEFNTYELR